MKTESKAKYLQHFASKKKQDKGFTLVELLVVVIVIGVLAAIGLPSMLGQANRARESGAKSNLGVINRAQQAYKVEYGTYAADDDFDAGAAQKLGIERPETPDYTFTTANTGESTATNKGTVADLRNFCGNAATGAVDVCAAPPTPTPTPGSQ